MNLALYWRNTGKGKKYFYALVYFTGPDWNSESINGITFKDVPTLQEIINESPSFIRVYLGKGDYTSALTCFHYVRLHVFKVFQDMRKGKKPLSLCEFKTPEKWPALEDIAKTD